MPKKKKPGRPPKNASNSPELEQALDFFGRAEKLYPQLVAQRNQLAGELAKVEQALSRLQPVIGQRANATPAPKPTAAVKSAPAPVGRPKGKPGRRPGSGPTLSNLLVDVLGRAKEPLGASDLVRLVREQRPDAGIAGMQKVLRELRDRGAVKATGKAKRFRYSLTKGGAVAPAPAPAKAQPSAKKAKTKGKVKSAPAKRGPKPGGGPSVREILLGALAGGKSLGMSELIDAATSKRSDVKRNSVETIIHKLRRDGVLKATGQSGAYKFSAA